MNTSRKLAEIEIKDRDAHLHPFTSVPDLLQNGPTVIVEANGCLLKDSAGNTIYDAAAGLWCVNVGHGRREVIEAIYAQLGKLDFFHSFNGMSNEPAALLARRLLDIAPANMRRVFFGNSGSDAVDTAVKIIWFYNNLRGNTKKKKIIARKRSYHGATIVAASVGGLPPNHRLFDLPLPFVRHVSCPDSYHFPDRDASFYAAELDDLIRGEGPESVAGFFAEPVMGTGGVVVPPKGYYEAISAILRRHDVLLVSDEVITGFGRLGTWFGLERFGYTPDLITCSKGLTSNYIPMSALIVGSKIWDELDSRRNEVGVFSHGFTTSGHPVAAAAGLAVLKLMDAEGMLPRAETMGQLLLRRMQDRLADREFVGDVRGCGLMVGVELVADKATKRSFDPKLGAGRKLQLAGLRNGVLVRALPTNDVIALSPPLIITEKEIDEIVERLSVAVNEVATQLRGH